MSSFCAELCGSSSRAGPPPGAVGVVSLVITTAGGCSVSANFTYL